MTCGVMTGNKNQAVLKLKATPNLRNPDHKKYFYSIKSDKMKEITQLYKEKNDASETNNSKQKSIKELVACLLDLRSNDWYNSIDALPAETDHKKMLLQHQIR